DRGAEEANEVRRARRALVARAARGRVRPEEIAAHADREGEPERRQHVDPHAVGPADDDRLARPEAGEPAAQPRPRAQRRDRRTPGREAVEPLAPRERAEDARG